MPPRAKQVARRVRAQPTAMDIEISNQRAADLTAARAEIARLQAENARLQESRARYAVELAEARDAARMPPQQVPLSPGDRVSFPRDGDGYFQGVVQGQTAPGYYMVTWMDGSSFEVSHREVALLSRQTTTTPQPQPFSGQGHRLGLGECSGSDF